MESNTNRVDRYAVNDAMSALAWSFGARLDDDTLNELVHHVADVLDGEAPTSYEYGDAVDATYTPTTFDPTPITRRGVVVEPHYGEEYTEVFFGTVEEYNRFMDDGDFQEGHNRTGVFLPSELKKAGA